jgi:light-regulated signal transduction histidine kinase (bacteriophytochrome)
MKNHSVRERFIYIEDNGIGFEEKYRKQIFKPFQRLHGRSAYEGTGMGLAICKKIIERHKGEILVESSLGEGSIFQVVLPATAPLNRAFIQCLDIQFSGMLIDCCSAPRYDNRRNIIHETKIIL